MRGRKPKPTALKALEGNPGKRKLAPEAEPQFAPGDLTPPDWLDERAKEEWARVAPALHATRLLSEVDRTMLAAYCNAISRWRKAEDIVSQSASMVFKTPTGYVQQIPHVGIASRYLEQATKLAAEFGFTPAARARLHVQPADKPSDDDKFFGFPGKEKGAGAGRPIH
jgi:P27 family predicted phage terminase small subunit